MKFSLRAAAFAAILSCCVALPVAAVDLVGSWSRGPLHEPATVAGTRSSDEPQPLSILEDAMTFALHDAAFTIYHEIGHLLVGELGLPVLGKEEDAVDAWATIWMLEFDEDEDSYDALIDAADGWYFNAVKSTGSGIDDLSYSSDHSLDIQRAYAMVCFMVGKDPEVFGETADIYEIGKDRQEDCAYTYEQAMVSWMSLLEPHLLEDDARPSKIKVIYEDAGEYDNVAEALKAYGIIDYAAEVVSQSFALPRPVTFRATQCGEPNAFYSPSDGEVIYCYELGEYMYAMYLYDIMGWGDTAN